MIDHLFMMAADFGRRPLIWIPGTFVGMAPKGPRTSAGASGLGSQVSCWLGPPRIQRMMTEEAFFVGRPCASAFDSQRSRLGSASPVAPSIPARSMLRRSICFRWSRYCAASRRSTRGSIRLLLKGQEPITAGAGFLREILSGLFRDLPLVQRAVEQHRAA